MMDFLISSLHACRLCAMACVSAKDLPVHYTMLSIHIFSGLPLSLWLGHLILSLCHMPIPFQYLSLYRTLPGDICMVLNSLWGQYFRRYVFVCRQGSTTPTWRGVRERLGAGLIPPCTGSLTGTTLTARLPCL